MRLVVFGATGQTGRLLVEQALAAGHEVTAFARDPARLVTSHRLLTVVQGDVTDSAAVERAVQGADAVISVLNTQREAASQPLTRGTRNILAAMKEHGVRRLVFSSSAPSASDPNDTPDIRFMLLAALVKCVVRSAYEDIAGSVRAVESSDTDWTIVRMPLPTNARGAGRVNVGYVGKNMGMRIARADAAAFMLREVQAAQYVRHTPVICSH